MILSPSRYSFWASRTNRNTFVSIRYEPLLNVTKPYSTLMKATKSFFLRIYLALPKLDFRDFKFNISKLLINSKELAIELALYQSQPQNR
jgi:hypothetical protein